MKFNWKRYLPLILLIILYYIIILLLVYTYKYKGIVIGWSFPFIVIAILLLYDRDPKCKFGKEKCFLSAFLTGYLILISTLALGYLVMVGTGSRSLAILSALVLWAALALVTFRNDLRLAS